jgi:outer membrane protein
VIAPLFAVALAAAQAANSQPAPGAPQAPPPPAPQAAPARPLLTLEQAIHIGLQNNPDLLRSQYQSQSAEQDVVINRAAILPRLDFNASATALRQGIGAQPVAGVTTGATRDFWNFSGSLRATQLVFDGGKWWNNLDAAKLQFQSTEATVQEQRLQTMYAVEQRFYELIRAQRQLQVLGEAAQRSRDQADFTQRLFQGGRATQADVYAARANRDNDEINRLGQEARVELARQDLAITLGIDPAEPLAIAEPSQMELEPSQPPVADQAVAKALTSRPSLRAFALTLEAQHKTASAARGDYWPQISLAASYARTTNDLAAIYETPLVRDSQFAGGVNLTWNLFNGLATKAAVEKADIAAASAEVDLLSGRRAVASDVERAIAQLAVARQQAGVAAQSVQTSSENLRLARTRQQVGVGTQLEVRDAELKLTQSELARANALVDGHEAEAALRRAIGG